MKESTRSIIQTGYRLGNLTVANDTGMRKNGYTVWMCDCICGGTIALDTRTLQRETIQDCGCLTKVRPGQRDISGKRFGKLIALEPTQERSPKGDTVWKCQCDCGNIVYSPLTQLTQGYKKSCGCISHPQRKDYLGKRFGRLLVTKYNGKSGGLHRWECICDCGKTTIVGQTSLQSGKTKSCGCLQTEIAFENMKFMDGTSVTMLEKANQRMASNNSSGYNGVYFNRKNQKWTAQIGFKGKNYYLGSYCRIEDAVKARQNAEDRIYGAFLEWYYETHPKNHQSVDESV